MSTYGSAMHHRFAKKWPQMLNDVSRYMLGKESPAKVSPAWSLCHASAVPTWARADSPPQATLWIRQRGSGVDNTQRVKRQEAPETLVITQVSQQCAALSPPKETDMNAKSKRGHFFFQRELNDGCPSKGEKKSVTLLNSRNKPVKGYSVCFANPALSNTRNTLNFSRLMCFLSCRLQNISTK